MRPVLRVVILGLAAAVLAAACGGEDEPTTGGAGSDGPERAITVNWGTEPPSLDPGLATDTTSANILQNIMDPLLTLDDRLEPVPALAESWDVARGGRVVTFHLRDDGRWTNGDPVTAEDFEWSWKRTLSPGLGADYAYQFFGIVGAEAYNSCSSSCARLRDEVGVEAVDDRTLRVTLVAPQPWFVQQMAHHSFLAVHRPTVERFGDRWTEARNIVTNGPFRLERWAHDSRIDLVKWDEWRNAQDVELTRVNGRMISDGTTAVQAFEAGETDADVNGPPPDQLPRFKGTEVYEQYPALGTYYYGFNTKSIPDVKQRRAMALAIDRLGVIANITQADQLPASGYTPKGMPGWESITPRSPWLPAGGDMARAKRLMASVEQPKRDITLWFNNAPGHQPIAVYVQSLWKELGLRVTLKQQEFAQYLEFLGPPPNDDVDVFRLGWIGDFPDAMNFLEQWTCESGNNNTNYCDPAYDRLVRRAQQTPDDEARFRIYRQLEQRLLGRNGAVPIAPIYWYTYPALEKPEIKDTFSINPLRSVDLTKVRVAS